MQFVCYVALMWAVSVLGFVELSHRQVIFQVACYLQRLFVILIFSAGAVAKGPAWVSLNFGILNPKK